MPIREHRDRAGHEWTTFTGEEIQKARGLLTESGNEAYRKSFHENEGKWQDVIAPDGQLTAVKKQDTDSLLAQGYRTPEKPTMIVPKLPWEARRLPPGRHRFRYNKATRAMEAV